MRIILNGISLISSGGMVSAKNLVKSLTVLDEKNSYLLLFPEGSGYEEISLPSNFEIMLFRRKKFNDIYRLYLDNSFFPRIAKKWKADVFFTLCNLGPIKLDIPHLVMVRKPYFVYDESYLYNNWSLTGKLNLKFQKKIMNRVLKNSTAVTVQTDVMKTRIMESFNLSNDKVSIIPNALMEENLVINNNITEFPYDYLKQESKVNLLALAQYYPHKNLEIIIEVAEELLSRKIKNFKFILTVDESHHSNVKFLLEEIKKRDLQNYITNVGVVKPNDLQNLYKVSDYLFMPTVLETFGNPYVEAMYNKIPIFTSDLDFARYMCRDAAIYFNPFNPREIADKISKEILEANKQQNEMRIEKGIEIVEEKFISWETIAQNYLDLLYSISK
ncbi:glycosyltransferase [Priestia aryabhattai]|uniref:glycosyltransferase n=1 Tax=Priestia aryabhattai TaxID=412384 RepID=UPI002452A556|nr:glycosyltransferase [Priestia aryabhattai]MDH3115877.1 glycosyltransferase [Priestia aryabhattai]MDH3125230.1 glycosyltransferase [Priestia aryabhattai]